MRARDLDAHYTVVHRTILLHQDPVTGLLPAHQIGRPCYPTHQATPRLHPGQSPLMILTSFHVIQIRWLGVLAWSTAGCEEHAWIRDNVYSVMSVWALAMAFR